MARRWLVNTTTWNNRLVGVIDDDGGRLMPDGFPLAVLGWLRTS